MSLQEKKYQHTLETEIIPEINNTLNELIGAEVSINIIWDSFTDFKAMQEIHHQVLGRIEEAVRMLCKDDFAKNLLKDSFKSISVKQIESADNKKVEFSDNELRIQANWLDFGNIFTPEDIRTAIEAGL